MIKGKIEGRLQKLQKEQNENANRFNVDKPPRSAQKEKISGQAKRLIDLKGNCEVLKQKNRRKRNQSLIVVHPNHFLSDKKDK